MNSNHKLPISSHHNFKTHFTSLPIETIFLLNGIKADEAGIKQLLKNEINWDSLVKSACYHDIAPLLYYNLRAMETAVAIPQSVMNALKKKYNTTLGQHLLAHKVLSELINALKQEHIQIIVLKGIALANTVYPNIACRHVSDIDILVKKEETSIVEKTLLDLGYIPEGTREWYKAKNHHHLIPYVTQDKSTKIEIHWTIESPPCSLKMLDGMWERVQPAEIGDAEVLMLSPEDLILHLCLHASFQHRFKIVLKHICDISETIQHYQDKIDWKQLKNTADEYGIIKFIYCTLSLTKKMLGTEILALDDALNELKPDTFNPQLINFAEERILPKKSSRTPSSLICASLPEKLIDKFKVTLRNLFPPRRKVVTRFPICKNSILLYPFYLVYPFSVIKRNSSSLWRFICHDKAILSEVKQTVALERWLSS